MIGKKSLCKFAGVVFMSFIFTSVNGNSAYATKQEVSIPQKLQIINQSITDNKVTLIWEKPDDYTGIRNYNIYENGYKVGDANSGSRVAKQYLDKFYNDSTNSDAVKIGIHNYTVTGLEPNTKYNFTIRAIDKDGNESKDSEGITVETASEEKVFNVLDYGAKGDGTSIDTKEIQDAINACANGGTVLIPKDKTFKTGPISLKGNMTFKVDGVLFASENADEYPYGDITKVSKATPLIKGNSDNIRIVGSGVIDGNGWLEDTAANDPNGFFVSLPSSSKTVEQNGKLAANQYKKAIKEYGFSVADAYRTRSNLIEMNDVKNLYLGDGLTLKNPSQHTVTNNRCNNVVLNGLKMETYNCNNGDGSGLVNGKGLTVVDSVLDTGDDNVAFNAGKGLTDSKNEPTENIWIFNNYFGRGHGAVVCGSGTAAWIQNILAEDNVLNGTGTGLRCKSSQGNGGGARNIIFRDTAMKDLTDNGGQPFIFTSQYNGDLPSNPVSEPPLFKDIKIKNCSVDGAKGNAIMIQGLQNGEHNNIDFYNVKFKNTKPALLDYAKNCTFKNVTFDESLINPWIITNSTKLKFKGKTTMNVD
ncbi:glycoside hydrolase family 28 protein [Clostridium sp. SHJSY1]|uniref:glycoside hydrolase family 28 protein n=1 Tax=Clostridium sp. SHJSY1 TaxID=2942483 RepID=UPI002875E422|nr:glycoside hydrolase family 28 protein [Clostridium sp. SHJSY1]MDS0525131.1 glycoside hydrolase family 28 protein [Clostridium sp. SHJSY1]